LRPRPTIRHPAARGLGEAAAALPRHHGLLPPRSTRALPRDRGGRRTHRAAVVSERHERPAGGRLALPLRGRRRRRV
ncbi:MAG: hypothetical protein AVDCRST_MAG11-3072, partial [uncultured Gemmatimonadaceae bacterium]